jgi:hypothetical protein
VNLVGRLIMIALALLFAGILVAGLVVRHRDAGPPPVYCNDGQTSVPCGD